MRAERRPTTPSSHTVGTDTYMPVCVHLSLVPESRKDRMCCPSVPHPTPGSPRGTHRAPEKPAETEAAGAWESHALWLWNTELEPCHPRERRSPCVISPGQASVSSPVKWGWHTPFQKRCEQRPVHTRLVPKASRTRTPAHHILVPPPPSPPRTHSVCSPLLSVGFPTRRRPPILSQAILGWRTVPRGALTPRACLSCE